jgi:hypothetical protein
MVTLLQALGHLEELPNARARLKQFRFEFTSI